MEPAVAGGGGAAGGGGGRRREAPSLGGRRWRDGEAVVASAGLGDGIEREPEDLSLDGREREREMEEGARKKPRRENFGLIAPFIPCFRLYFCFIPCF